MSGLPMTSAQRRVFEARAKQRRKVESLSGRAQPRLPAVIEKAELARHEWKGVPKMSEFGAEDLVLPALPAVPLESVEQAQVSFEYLRRCLRCRSINKYGAVECKKCHGRFIFDKTAWPDVPKQRKESENYGE